MPRANEEAPTPGDARERGIGCVAFAGAGTFDDVGGAVSSGRLEARFVELISESGERGGSCPENLEEPR